MKNRIIILGLLMSLVGVFTGCSNDDLEDKFLNPEKSTTPSIPGFFTSMLNNDRVRPSYWNVRTFLLLQPAVYSQTAFFSNGNTRYQESTGYTEQFWDGFYVNNGNGSGPLSTYVAMNTTYNGLSDEDKASMAIFMNAGKVVLIDEASQMVDMWGDIPFTEAGSLISSSTIVNPAFDDQATLYNTFLAELESVATYFKTATTTATFSKNDILNSGSVDKWLRYTNSIRLRLLMRLSMVDESTVKPKIQTLLANELFVDGSNNANYSPASADILLRPLTTYTDNLNSALTELSSHYAPDYMLNTLMIPANDPRIPVMFDKYGATVGGSFIPNKEYGAMPITFDANDQETQYMYYSILDSATFLQNPSLPGIVMTASETNFLKAEAFERWGGGDAQSAYETAVKQSVSFYFYLNNLNSTGLKTESKPDASVIDDFVTNSSIAYSGTAEEKLEKIWDQKWLHFSFLQSIQAWSEYRRTNYPQLTFPSSTLVGYETPPTRLLYPSGEAAYNSENYKAVQAEDTRDTKIFWDVN